MSSEYHLHCELSSTEGEIIMTITGPVLCVKDWLCMDPCSHVFVYMLRTDCQPNQFINGPPVWNPVGLLLINTSKKIPFKNWAERFINWPNSIQAGRTVYKLAEQLIPRTNGRNSNHFHTCGSLPSAVVPWGSFNKRWQSSLTCEPLRLYYVCRLRETFQRDPAEMAPCWWLHSRKFYHKTFMWPVTAL